MVVADRHDRAPGPSREEIRGQHEQDHGHAQRQEVEPLVLAQGQMQGRLGLAQHDALGATGPVLEVLEDLGDGQGQGEGGQGQVESLQTQGGPAEEEADDQAHEAGRRDRPSVAHAPPVDHDRAGVGADRVEGAVTERELPVVAGEQVESEESDRVDQDLAELEQPEPAHEEGQGGGGRHDHQQSRHAQGSPARGRPRGGERGLAACRRLRRRPGSGVRRHG